MPYIRNTLAALLLLQPQVWAANGKKAEAPVQAQALPALPRALAAQAPVVLPAAAAALPAASPGAPAPAPAAIETARSMAAGVGDPKASDEQPSGQSLSFDHAVPKAEVVDVPAPVFAPTLLSSGLMDRAALAAYLEKTAAAERHEAVSPPNAPKIAWFESGDYSPAYELGAKALGYEMVRVKSPSRSEIDALSDKGFVLKSEWMRWVMPVRTLAEYIADMKEADCRPDRGAQKGFERRLRMSERLEVKISPLTLEDYAAWFPVYRREFSNGRVMHLDADWARKQLVDRKDTTWRMIVFRNPDDKTEVIGGMIMKLVPERGHLSLGFAAYASEHKKLEMQARGFVAALEMARELGFKRLSYGADRTRFGGFDFGAIGLMEYKVATHLKAFPEDRLLLEKDLVSAERRQPYFVFGINPEGPLQERYLRAREKSKDVAAEDLLGGALLEPGTMSPGEALVGHFYSSDPDAKVRAPREIRLVRHELK